MLVEQCGQRVGHGCTWQARQIGVVRVQPDRNLTFPVTKDHGSLVVAAATSYSGAGSQQLSAASGRPINRCRVRRGGRMPWVGINVIKPPRDEAATGMLNSGRKQVLHFGRSQQGRPVGVPRNGHGADLYTRLRRAIGYGWKHGNVTSRYQHLGPGCHGARRDGVGQSDQVLRAAAADARRNRDVLPALPACSRAVR